MFQNAKPFHPHLSGLDADDLRSLFEDLEALRRSARVAAAAARPHRISRLRARAASAVAALRAKARGLARTLLVVSLVLTIHALAMALADRAYAPYRIGPNDESARDSATSPARELAGRPESSQLSAVAERRRSLP